MTRDPFYKKIIEGLNDKFDPELFEQCAADISMAEWPKLVSARGGANGGMDKTTTNESGGGLESVNVA